MIRVYLADDEFFVRTSLKENIPWTENDFEIVGEANNGKTAFEQILSLKPDIAIIDINMPGYNGIELITLLSEKDISCRYIILTGYSEFQYAQKALRLGVDDYILKPIDYDLFVNSLKDVSQTLQSEASLLHKVENLQSENQKLILEQYYNDLINCSLTSNSTSFYTAELSSPHFLLHYSAFTLAIINTSLSGRGSHLQELLQTMNTNITFVNCADNQKRIFLIINSEQTENLHMFFENILNMLYSKGISAYIGVGNSYSAFEQIYLSYNEASMAIQNYEILNTSIIYYCKLKNSPDFSGLDTKTKNRLKTCILDKDPEKVKALIDELYLFFHTSKTTYNSVILYTMELIYLLTEILSSKASQPVSIIRSDENILDKLNAFSNIEGIHDWILVTYINSITELAAKDTCFSDITQRIEAYIANNYSNPELSIPMIAEKLYLNYSYLCLCFKRDKSITINDYLNQIRIDKAVEMFQSGIDNVGYIAEKCGFNNAGYFSKKFKKTVGISPSEYVKTL